MPASTSKGWYSISPNSEYYLEHQPETTDSRKIYFSIQSTYPHPGDSISIVFYTEELNISIFVEDYSFNVLEPTRVEINLVYDGYNWDAIWKINEVSGD